jgi:hypothetical protein
MSKTLTASAAAAAEARRILDAAARRILAARLGAAEQDGRT